MSPTFTLIICPRCEHRNRRVARFCARCGDTLHDAPRMPRTGRTSGARTVIGLLLIGVVLASIGLFARVKPERPMPMNLWNPPDMDALYEREQAREHFAKQLHRKRMNSHPPGKEAGHSGVTEYHMQGPYREIVE